MRPLPRYVQELKSIVILGARNAGFEPPPLLHTGVIFRRASNLTAQLRLALLSLLSGVEEAEFTWLRTKTGATDGNLGARLLKLEEAGYMSVKKKFLWRKPQTVGRITGAGRRALAEYVRALQQLLGVAVDVKSVPRHWPS